MTKSCSASASLPPDAPRTTRSGPSAEQEAFSQAVVSLNYTKRARSLFHSLVDSGQVRIFQVSPQGIVETSASPHPSPGADITSWAFWPHLAPRLRRMPMCFRHKCFEQADGVSRFTTVLPRYAQNRVVGWVVQTYLSTE